MWEPDTAEWWDAPFHAYRKAGQVSRFFLVGFMQLAC